MIGLIAIAIVAVWFSVVIYLSKRISLPRWLGTNLFVIKFARFVVFVIILVLPMADDLIGRWQFNNLCKREAVANLSPDWKSVKRARRVSVGPIHLNGYIIKIIEWQQTYIDTDTGLKFLEYKGFVTHGGFLMNDLGLGLGTFISCSPPNIIQIYRMIDIDRLIKQGKMK